MTRACVVAGLIGSVLAGGCAAHHAKSPVAAVGKPEGPVIVRLVGRHQSVIVTSSKKGPLYSVQNDADGKMLVANTTLDELRVEHPDVYRLVEPTIAVDASVEGRTALPAQAPMMLDSARE